MRRQKFLCSLSSNLQAKGQRTLTPIFILWDKGSINLHIHFPFSIEIWINISDIQV